MLRALALRFERYINFRVVRDPSVSKMTRLGLPSDYFYHVPGLVLLVSENFHEPARRKFFAVQYDKSAMSGELSYPKALMFLFQVNRQFRHTLPGDNGSDDLKIVRAEDALEEEREIFDIREEHFDTGGEQRMAAPAVKERPAGRVEL